MDQLQMHITSAIHNTAWNVVYGHAMLSNTAELVSRNFFDVPNGLVNLKNIEKSLQEPNVEKAMSFIRVRLDYLDHKQKSLNFDRKI